MAQKPKSFVIAMLSTCLILFGLAAQGYSQEKSQTIKNPETQQPARKPGLTKRPPRYPAALAGLEVVADLSVSPPNYTGQCPAVFTFKGKITVNRAATVQYRFVRSDNTRHSLGVLTFEKAGSQEVTDTWVFDDPTQLPTFRGWEAIQVNLPMKVKSNLAHFKGTCTDYKGGAPTPQSPKIQESPQGPVPKKLPGSKGPQADAPKSLPWPQQDPLLPPVKR